MEMEALNLNITSGRQIFDLVHQPGHNHNNHLQGQDFGPGSTTIEFMLRSFDQSSGHDGHPSLFAFNNGPAPVPGNQCHPLISTNTLQSCPTSSTASEPNSNSTLSTPLSRDPLSSSTSSDTLPPYESSLSSSSPETKGGRPHSCNLCDASYKTRTHLRRHMIVHLVRRPYPCAHCGKGFNRKEHLSKHAEAVHSAVKFVCPFCEKQISRKDHLARHIKNMHPSYAEFLNKDGFLSDVSKSLLKVSSPPKSVKRGKSKRSASSRNSNSKVVAPLPPPTAALRVPGSFGSSDWAGLDSLEGSSSRIFLDNETFQNIQQLGGIPASIVISGQITPATVTLTSAASTPPTVSTPASKSKVQSQLPAPKPPNPSPNGLLGLTNLSLTLGGQIKEAPFASCSSESKKLASTPGINSIHYCPECSLNFASEKDLSSHIRSHKSPTFRCSQCPRAYTRREKLTEHIRCFHEGEKFRCEHCGKELSRKDHVLRHVRSIHPELLASRYNEMTAGEHPENLVMDQDEEGRLSFPLTSSPIIPPSKGTTSNSAVNEMNTLLRSICQYCLKVFGTSYHLSRHVESCHSGDLRPHPCPSAGCSKMFKRKDHLSKHLKSHCHTVKDSTPGRRVTPSGSSQNGSNHPANGTINKTILTPGSQKSDKKSKNSSVKAGNDSHPKKFEESLKSRQPFNDEPPEDFNLVMINSFMSSDEAHSSLILGQDLTPPNPPRTSSSDQNSSSVHGLTSIQFSNY